MLQMNVINILRGACLFTTTLAMLVLTIWHLKPALVNRLDAELNPRFGGKINQQAVFDAQINQQAIKINMLYRAGNYAAAMELALQELQRLDDVRKLHVVYDVKRSILLKLFQSSAKLGSSEMELNLPVIAAWAASDRRDLDALKAYIYLLQNIPGRDQELQEALIRLQRQFPGVPASPAPGIDTA